MGLWLNKTLLPLDTYLLCTPRPILPASDLCLTVSFTMHQPNEYQLKPASFYHMFQAMGERGNSGYTYITIVSWLIGNWDGVDTHHE